MDHLMFFSGSTDPFANNRQNDATQPTFQRTNKIHLRLQKRGNKKFLTIVEGLDEDLDEVRICRHMRRAFNCNGAVLKGEDNKPILQLQGDQRQSIKEWLLAQEILTEKEAKERLVTHGA
jgi:translation initiation factor 1